MIKRNNKTKIYFDLGSYSIKVAVGSLSNICYFNASTFNNNSDYKDFVKDIKLSPSLSFRNDLRAFWKGKIVDEEKAISVIRNIKQKIFKDNNIKSFDLYLAQSPFLLDQDKLKISQVFEKSGLPSITFVSEPLVDSIGSLGKIKNGEYSILINTGFSKASIYLLNGNNIELIKNINGGLHKIIKRFIKSIYEKKGLILSYEQALELIIERGDLIIQNNIEYNLAVKDQNFQIKEMKIDSEFLKEALRTYADKIISKIIEIKHEIRIEVYQSIINNGICISGGIANIANLDVYIRKTLEVSVFSSEAGYKSVIKGLVDLLS